MTVGIGATAPDFTLADVNGRTYSLREALTSGTTVLVFFKTGCPASDLTFPYLNRLASSYREGWNLWAIAQEPPDRARQYAQEQGVKYPVLPDIPDYAVSRLYDPPASPTFFLVEPDGRVAFASHGFSKDDLNQLSRLLSERLGVSAQEVAPADDGRPAFRPG